MTLPILVYGWNLLRQRCEVVHPGFPNLNQLIDNLWETMYNAKGCGMAAPQIGEKINLFIIDSKMPYANMAPAKRKRYFEEDDMGIDETFLNASILSRSEQTWTDKEGCLSIPGLIQPITRSWSITVEYVNRHFEKQIREFSGLTARMIQHEYDHTQGVLFIDYLEPLRRRLLEAKLEKIVWESRPIAYPIKLV